MSSEDVDYLHLKGALSIPDSAFCTALLQAFSDYIYPCMPILSINALMDCITQQTTFTGGCERMSLLLFQAVLFAAIPFVQTDLLFKAGYSSRREARMLHYQRTRVSYHSLPPPPARAEHRKALYDFDYEADTITNIQALLLMTYWHETSDDQKDASHWMGVASTLGQGMNLHRHQGPAVTSTQKLHRRIWWSCFMRDQLISLALRRLPNIGFDDFTTPMLEDGDFEVYSASESDKWTPLGNASRQQELVALCISKAKLCVCLSRVLSTQYKLLPRSSASAHQFTSGSNMMLLPRPDGDLGTVYMIDQELLEWDSSLPACCRNHGEIPQAPSHGDSAIMAQRKLLHMIFHTTVLTLHRPQCEISSHSSAEAAFSGELSRYKVSNAAKSIGKLVTEIRALHLKEFLPSVGMTAIVPAMVVLLMDMRDATSPDPTSDGRYFDNCMELLRGLGEAYSVADDAMAVLRVVMASHGL
ncbi:hypothetical protein ACJ41O_005632 [Fusarium nematophilum]